MMDRVRRYKQKMDFIVNKVNDIPDDFDSSLKVDATLYRIQTAIESAMDIIAMLTKDVGKEVGDDYSNINQLHKAGLYEKGFAAKLISIIGLRNAIVHKYNSFEESSVIDNIDEIKDILIQLLEYAENKTKTIFKNDKKRT